MVLQCLSDGTRYIIQYVLVQELSSHKSITMVLHMSVYCMVLNTLEQAIPVAWQPVLQYLMEGATITRWQSTGAKALATGCPVAMAASLWRSMAGVARRPLCPGFPSE